MYPRPQRGSIQIGNVYFSETEIKDILKAWIAISLAFSFILTSGFDGFLSSFIISALTVGVGFIAHELGHKIVAQKYGAWAEFRAWDQMLLLAVALAFFLGVVFAAPGAVMITGRTIGKTRYGKVASAGPVMSYVTALVFLGVQLSFSDGILNSIGEYGFMINTWLGLFNMIPFGMLDGKKIWNWDKTAFIVLVLVGVGLMYLRSII